MKRKGFTVIELLIVMLIIGLLFILTSNVRTTGAKAAEEWQSNQEVVMYVQVAEKVKYETRFKTPITDTELVTRINSHLQSDYKITALSDLPEEALDILE